MLPVVFWASGFDSANILNNFYSAAAQCRSMAHRKHIFASVDIKRLHNMEKKNVTVPPFLSDNGITSTSANHIANIAKENCQALEGGLASLDFHKTTVSLIGAPEETVVSFGNGEDTLSSISGWLEEMAVCKSLIAYLREAIKAKERLVVEATDAVSSPELDSLLENEPELEEPLDENQVLDRMGIGQKTRYLALEAKCAAFGKCIHPDGSFSSARKKFQKRLAGPKDIRENGRDTLIYSYYPNVPASDVEDLFFRLQAEHRAAQAELNGIKHGIEVEIRRDAEAKRNRWTAEHEKWQGEVALAREALNAARERKREEVEKLKIVIPDSLRPIYEKLRQL